MGWALHGVCVWGGGGGGGGLAGGEDKSAYRVQYTHTCFLHTHWPHMTHGRYTGTHLLRLGLFLRGGFKGGDLDFLALRGAG